MEANRACEDRSLGQAKLHAPLARHLGGGGLLAAPGAKERRSLERRAWSSVFAQPSGNRDASAPPLRPSGQSL